MKMVRAGAVAITLLTGAASAEDLTAASSRAIVERQFDATVGLRDAEVRGQVADRVNALLKEEQEIAWKPRDQVKHAGIQAWLRAFFNQLADGRTRRYGLGFREVAEKLEFQSSLTREQPDGRMPEA